MTRSAHPIFFEMARLHAFWGDPITAKAILDKGHRTFHTEWKLGLELIQQRLREGDLLGAVNLNRQFVRNYRGSGRVWSCMIQLVHQYLSSLVISRLDCVVHRLHSSSLFTRCDMWLNRVKCGVKEREFS